MGGLVGAALVYANYFHAIDIFEGGRGVRTLKTADLFSTYAVCSLIGPENFQKSYDDMSARLYDSCILFLF